MKPAGRYPALLPRKEVKPMLIPNPIVTFLTAVACKVVCDALYEEDDKSALRRVIRDHDTYPPDIVRDLIREELDRRTEQGDEDDEEED